MKEPEFPIGTKVRTWASFSTRTGRVGKGAVGTVVKIDCGRCIVQFHGYSTTREMLPFELEKVK